MPIGLVLTKKDIWTLRKILYILKYMKIKVIILKKITKISKRN